MSNPYVWNKYTYYVTWSDPDEEYVGLCAEFPSLSWLGESHEVALKGILKVVRNVIEGTPFADIVPSPHGLLTQKAECLKALKLARELAEHHEGYKQPDMYLERRLLIALDALEDKGIDTGKSKDE